MNAKEHIISELLNSLADYLSPEQAAEFSYCASNLFLHYDVVPTGDLPSESYDISEPLIKKFLVTKKIEGCGMKTLLQYKYHVLRFSQVINLPLHSIDTNSIRCYLGTFSVCKQNSYIDTIRRCLNSFYQWMEDEEYIDKNPCKKIKRIKTEKKMELPFSDTEIAQIQDACITPKEIAFIDILLSTGIRREEITKITLSDIDFDRCSIKIHGKGAKERFVYFSARCKLHLRNYLESRNYSSQWLFAQDKVPHGQLSVESMHAYVKIIGARAAVHNVHLHRFRKWFGTSMADKGVDIRDLKELMGHDKIETTNEYYIYSNLERIRAEHHRYAA